MWINIIIYCLCAPAVKRELKVNEIINNNRRNCIYVYMRASVINPFHRARVDNNLYYNNVFVFLSFEKFSVCAIVTLILSLSRVCGFFFCYFFRV